MKVVFFKIGNSLLQRGQGICDKKDKAAKLQEVN